jgi:hypothetical protein
MAARTITLTVCAVLDPPQAVTFASARLSDSDGAPRTQPHTSHTGTFFSRFLSANFVLAYYTSFPVA